MGIKAGRGGSEKGLGSGLNSGERFSGMKLLDKNLMKVGTEILRGDLHEGIKRNRQEGTKRCDLENLR